MAPVPDMVLDVFRPASASGPLPLVVWVHGGGFVGGTKDELAGYFKVLAANGLAVAAPRYSLAPRHRYPAPLRQLMQALQFLQANAGRLLIGPDRIVLAGDSAGAHIAAQAGALVTTPGYAGAAGITPAITAAQLRGLVLACGPYDLQLGRHASSPAGRLFVQIVLRAYSGTRRFPDDPAFAAWSITGNVTSAFPPALITVGNADPLRPYSELSPASSALRGPKPRRSSSPPATSRHWAMSTSSTSTPTPGSSSSAGCSPSCGSGSQIHHSRQAPAAPTSPAQRRELDQPGHCMDREGQRHREWRCPW